MVGTGLRWTVCAAAVAAVLGMPCVARAETLESALAQAYRNNPTLNASRAALRATDEGVPQALAGYRPRVNFQADSGYQNYQSHTLAGGQFVTTNSNISPRGGTIGPALTVFNAEGTRNLTLQSQAAAPTG